MLSMINSSYLRVSPAVGDCGGARSRDELRSGVLISLFQPGALSCVFMAIRELLTQNSLKKIKDRVGNG